MKNNVHLLQAPDRHIPIEMQYGFRKRLTLTVYPDRRVIARIPYGFPQKKVEEYLQKKRAWLIKHLDHFEQHPPESDKRYIEGENFDYLGKKYALSLAAGSPRVLLTDERLAVRVKDSNDKNMISRAIDRWYRKKAVEIMTPRYEEIFDSLRYLHLPSTTLRFYKMKRRWGSCSSKYVITLNTELIKKDIALIDYVIVHEICHLKVPAHNKKFYALVASVMPDWKERKTKLGNS